MFMELKTNLYKRSNSNSINFIIVADSWVIRGNFTSVKKPNNDLRSNKSENIPLLNTQIGAAPRSSASFDVDFDVELLGSNDRKGKVNMKQWKLVPEEIHNIQGHHQSSSAKHPRSVQVSPPMDQ